jgi:hypothetical protein
MTKLSDTQRILLAAACQRADGSVLPLHASIKRGGGITKAIAGLMRQALVVERETNDQAAVHRTDGDLSFGAFVTEAGMAAIGVSTDDEGTSEAAAAQLPEIIDVEKAPTKIATVLTLLARKDGVPMADLMAATGWLPHTIRAAITGLRKRGHSIQRIKRDGMTCYRILGAA